MDKPLILSLFAIILIAGCVTSSVDNTTQNNTSLENNTSLINNTTQNNTSIPSGAVNTTNVEIKKNAFVPPVILVKKGATVTWVNRDYILHIVRFTNVQSPALSINDRWSYRFSTVGSFDYVSSISPSIQGTVVVIE